MTVWHMHIACWITKATNTITECVILVGAPLQQWLHECVPLFRYMHTACLILHKNPTDALKRRNTILCTLLHYYTLYPSRGHPQEVLIHFVSTVNRMRVQT